MKLIEKMAEDFAQNPMAIKRLMLDEGLGIGCPEIELGYIAGFRAARDLMCERFDWVEAGNQYTNMCQVGEEEIDLAPDPGTAPGT